MMHNKIGKMISNLESTNELIRRFYSHTYHMTKEEKDLQKIYEKNLTKLDKEIAKFSGKVFDDFYSKKYRF